MRERSAELAMQWIEAWARMDMEWLRRRLAPDFVHVSPFGRFEGRDAYLAAVEPMARKSSQELSVRETVASGDLAVVRYENRTSNGVVEACDWVRVGGGSIREIRSFYDSAPICEVLSPDEQDSLDGSSRRAVATRREGPMITTNGLNHLALPVADPRRSAEFYAELFNMRITSSSPEMAFLKTAGARDMIALNRSDVPIASSRDTMHFGFWVEPEQFDDAVRAIEERGVKKVSEPSRREIGRYIFIEDPDGYVVEIFECLEAPYAYSPSIA